MKKSIYLGIIALATLSLASCSKDEVVERVPQQPAIEFGTYLGRDAQSRAPQLTTEGTNGVELLNFGVFAFYTGKEGWSVYKSGTSAYPNFMYNQYVYRTAGASTWTYSPLKYWPTTKGDMISFFAYAPNSIDPSYTGIDVSDADASGTPTIDYSITGADLETQADFVADVVIDKTRTGSTTLDQSDENVVFKLNHELTRLGFTASLSRDAWDDTATNKTKVNIKSITFVPADEFATKATYTFANTNDIAIDNLVRGTWSNWTNTAGNLDLAKLLNSQTPSNTDLGGYVQPGVLVSDTNSVTIFKKDTNSKQHYLYLIPRGEGGISAAGKVKIEVAYDIVTVDGSLEEGHSVTPATKIIEFPAETLKQGVAYNFHLTFGLNEIVMSASVAAWGTDTPTGGNVDWPKADA